jgi:hypothetical protein
MGQPGEGESEQECGYDPELTTQSIDVIIYILGNNGGCLKQRLRLKSSPQKHSCYQGQSRA